MLFQKRGKSRPIFVPVQAAKENFPEKTDLIEGISMDLKDLGYKWQIKITSIPLP